MSQLTWIDRAGTTLGTAGEAGYYSNLDLDATDRRLAVSRFTEPSGMPWNVDVWTIDLTRAGTATRLTFHPAREFDPVWSPDGSQVAFNSSRLGGRYSLFRRPSSGVGDDELLVKSETGIAAPSWSPDGRLLIYDDQRPDTKRDLWMLPLSGARTPVPFLKTPFNESSGAISPDGRWIAYESDSSGRSEVYVRPFPESDRVYPVSRDGGHAPRWRGDGRELFFLALDGTMMAAGLASTKDFRATVPEPLFQSGLKSMANNHPYAVTKDGTRFLIPMTSRPHGAEPLTAILDWPATLRK